jgi:hypothetical protein
MRTYGDEIDVETLIAVAIFAQAIASQIFKVNPPTLLVRIVGRKIMLGGGRSFADTSDVLSNLNRKIVNVVRVPRITLNHGTAFGKSREFATKQKAESQQQSPGCHAILRRGWAAPMPVAWQRNAPVTYFESSRTSPGIMASTTSRRGSRR